jgi:hypothetical protein
MFLSHCLCTYYFSNSWTTFPNLSQNPSVLELPQLHIQIQTSMAPPTRFHLSGQVDTTDVVQLEVAIGLVHLARHPVEETV